MTAVGDDRRRRRGTPPCREKVTINRREVDLDDEGHVRRIVEEEIRIG